MEGERKVPRGLRLAVTVSAAAAGRAPRSAAIFPLTRMETLQPKPGVREVSLCLARASLPEPRLLGWMEMRHPRLPARSPTR